MWWPTRMFALLACLSLALATVLALARSPSRLAPTLTPHPVPGNAFLSQPFLEANGRPGLAGLLRTLPCGFGSALLPAWPGRDSTISDLGPQPGPEVAAPESFSKDYGAAFWARGRPIRRVVYVTVEGLDQLIRKYARMHGVDEKLVWAVMRQESGFNPRAVSPKGALGLMQLMPGTADLMGVTDPFNVEQNIAGGVRYLKICLNYFGQDLSLALAAYNAGPQNVVKYQGCPPFAETLNYVAAVLRDCAGGLRVRKILGFRASPGQPRQVLGLKWKVPAPQFKIATPLVNVPSPRWKKVSPSS